MSRAGPPQGGSAFGIIHIAICSSLPLGDEWGTDTIIVGARSAGAILAACLAEDPGRSWRQGLTIAASGIHSTM